MLFCDELIILLQIDMKGMLFCDEVKMILNDRIQLLFDDIIIRLIAISLLLFEITIMQIENIQW
jgi:hypothetical protein